MPITPSNPSCISPLRAASAVRGGGDGPVRRIRLGDKSVEYVVRRSRQRRKTYQISIVSGQIVVAVPYATTNRQAEDMVRHKAKWILAKLDASVTTPEAPAFLSGEKLPYRGRELTLWVQGVVSTETGQPEVSLERRRLKVAMPMGLGEEEQRRLVEDALMRWFGCRAGSTSRNNWPAGCRSWARKKLPRYRFVTSGGAGAAAPTRGCFDSTGGWPCWNPP